MKNPGVGSRSDLAGFEEGGDLQLEFGQAEVFLLLLLELVFENDVFVNEGAHNRLTTRISGNGVGDEFLLGDLLGDLAAGGEEDSIG